MKAGTPEPAGSVTGQPSRIVWQETVLMRVVAKTAPDAAGRRPTANGVNAAPTIFVSGLTRAVIRMPVKTAAESGP